MWFQGWFQPSVQQGIPRKESEVFYLIFFFFIYFVLCSLHPSITIPQVSLHRLDLITLATLLRCPLAPSVQCNCSLAPTCTLAHTKCSTSDRQTKAGQGTLSHLDMPLSTRTVKHLNHQSNVAIRETPWFGVARWLWTWIQTAEHLSKPKTQLMPRPRSSLWPSASTSLKHRV